MSTQSATTLAYIAGFLDGDGSIYVRAKPNPAYRYGFQIAPYVVFFQSSQETEFPNLMQKIGFGKMRIRKDGMYEFTIGKHEDLELFLQTILPYLQLKRLQAILMLEILAFKKQVSSAKDFEILLEMIEKFRTLNYSKKRIKRTLIP